MISGNISKVFAQVYFDFMVTDLLSLLGNQATVLFFSYL